MRRVPDLPPLARCKPCRHRGCYGTCHQPVAAGLSTTAGVVVWAPVGHQCAAFEAREVRR